MVNEYYAKNGGKWKAMAKMVGGHLAGGALVGIPLMIGGSEIFRPLGETPYSAAGSLGLGLGVIYGRMKGTEHEKNRVYNDIAKQRRDQLQ